VRVAHARARAASRLAFLTSRVSSRREQRLHGALAVSGPAQRVHYPVVLLMVRRLAWFFYPLFYPGPRSTPKKHYIVMEFRKQRERAPRRVAAHASGGFKGRLQSGPASTQASPESAYGSTARSHTASGVVGAVLGDCRASAGTRRAVDRASSTGSLRCSALRSGEVRGR
jgi:hypothetical protein